MTAGKVLTGTLSCWRLPDVGSVAPFTAVCQCGWWLGGQPSHRAAKRKWHEHVATVRDGLKAAAAS